MPMLDKFSRSRYFPTNVVNSITENDLAFSGFSDFVFTDEFKFYTLVESDIQRPDLISYKLYKRMNYWWIVMKLNSIEDIWDDLYVGQILKIPSEDDIQRLIVFMNDNKNK